MTFTDIITNPSKLFHSSSVNEHLNKKDQHQKHERLNLFPRNRQTNNLEKKNLNEQRNSFLHPSSELSRSTSNKSITFASIFDQSENENINKNNHSTFDIGTSIENEDLVIIVPNKYVNNEPLVNNSNTNTEPYPFRSELPSCSFPRSNSSTNMINSSHSGTKLLQHLIHHHRPKKLRHPVKTTPCLDTIDRSTSVPNTLCSLTSNSISTTNHRSIKTFRRWFKSSSFDRFLPSFIKHSNTSNTKYLKQKSRQKLIPPRKYNDLIY